MTVKHDGKYCPECTENSVFPTLPRCKKMSGECERCGEHPVDCLCMEDDYKCPPPKKFYKCVGKIKGEVVEFTEEEREFVLDSCYDVLDECFGFPEKDIKLAKSIMNKLSPKKC